MPRGRPSREAVFERLDRTVDELDAIGGIPLPEEAESIWEGIWFEETHNSTAIEGNTLIMKQVKTLLEEGRAVGDKELAEYLEVQGYAEAAQWVYSQAVRSRESGVWDFVTPTELREIHRLVVGTVWRHFPPDEYADGEGPGSFRRHDINPFASGMVPPPWPDVPPLATDWLDEANMHPGTATHYVIHVAERHAAFERIHPFRDGNGRTGRLVMNLMLVRAGFPPAVIYKRDRPKYLRGLERADSGEPEPLAELIARSVMHGIHRFLLPALAGPHRIIPLASLATEDLSLIALRRAAERGRLRAIRRSDQWYSTKEWVRQYSKSRLHQGKRQLRLL
jgi:fido (protein-threonine AMPylation protein)